MCLRLWKARASEKLGVIKDRERVSLQYAEKLKEKYAQHPQVNRNHSRRSDAFWSAIQLFVHSWSYPSSLASHEFVFRSPGFPDTDKCRSTWRTRARSCARSRRAGAKRRLTGGSIANRAPCPTYLNGKRMLWTSPEHEWLDPFSVIVHVSFFFFNVAYSYCHTLLIARKVISVFTCIKS